MSKHLFISDLHLEESRPDLADFFFRFLDEVAAGADSLYVLGDFFEVWLGDDDNCAFNLAVISRLKSLRARKFVMHGNRDFLLGEVFCDSAGATLLQDPTVQDIDGTKYLLMHGDSLCTRDEKYMQARARVRTEEFRSDFLARSLEERAAFALQARNESKRHTRESAADIMDVTPEDIPRVMRSHGVDTLIHGHTHRPAIHHLSLGGNRATRYVLGDWHTSTCYLAIENGQPELVRYSFRTNAGKGPDERHGQGTD